MARDVYDEVLDALKNIKDPGLFGGFKRLLGLPPADISVRGVGDIDMPLSDEQATELIAKARQAPAFCNTWELDADDVTFGDPRWSDFLADICDQVATQLGIEGCIRAELDKMVIYEQGAMLQPHTDTEKVPSTFGTLVICLPSPHEGGRVVLEYDDMNMQLDPSEHTQSFMCWYSGVTHKMHSIIAGYRWVLTYNLVQANPSQPQPTAGFQRSDLDHLEDALTLWLETDQDELERGKSCLYHILEYEYTEANISLHALEAEDLARVKALQQFRTSLSMVVFLALLEREDKGKCDDEGDGIDEILETKYRVKTLVDLDGRVVSHDLDLEECDILEPWVFDDLPGPADEKYEEDMDNCEPTATLWYRMGAVVLIPEELLIDYLQPSRLLSTHDLASQFSYLLRECMLPRPLQSKPSIDNLISLSRFTWDHNKSPRPSCDKVEMCTHIKEGILQAAIKYRKYQFFSEAVSHHESPPSTDFLAWLYDLLDIDKTRFGPIEKGLFTLMSRYPRLGDLVDAVVALVPDVVPPDCLTDFAQRILESYLETCKPQSFGLQEGYAMADLAIYFDRPSAFLEHSALSNLETYNAVPFAIGVVGRLQEGRHNFSTEQSDRISKAIATKLVNSADFSTLYSNEETQPHTCQPPQALKPQSAITLQRLSSFFLTLDKFSQRTLELTTQFAEKVAADVPQMSSNSLSSLWLPFLQDILPYLSLTGATVPIERFQNLYTAVLRAYLDKVVMPEPIRNDSLVRQHVDCPCSDCMLLNHFLVSPMSRDTRFSLNEKRRTHVLQMLDSARIDCTHKSVPADSPEILIVTKTSTQHAQRLTCWKARRTVAMEQFDRFQQYSLKKVLGSEYADIIHMCRILAPDPTRRVTQTSTARPSSLAGTKRKFETIDLTSD